MELTRHMGTLSAIMHLVDCLARGTKETKGQHLARPPERGCGHGASTHGTPAAEEDQPLPLPAVGRQKSMYLQVFWGYLQLHGLQGLLR